MRLLLPSLLVFLVCPWFCLRAQDSPSDDPVTVNRYDLKYAQALDQKIFQTADQTKFIKIPGVVTLLSSLVLQPIQPSTDDSSAGKDSSGGKGSGGDNGPPPVNDISPVAQATQAVADAMQSAAKAQASIAKSATAAAAAAKAGVNGTKVADDSASRGNGIPNIMADPNSNTVIVWDKKSHWPFYRDLIRKLDLERELIEISVAVIDIDANVDLNWGSEVQFGANGTVKGHPTSTRVGSSFPISSTVTTSGGSINPITDSLNTAANQMPPPGFGSSNVEGTPFSIAGVIASTSTRLVARIRALEGENKAHVLTRPSILTMANIPASFSDTSNLYIPVQGTNFANFFEVPVSSSINVLPRVASHEPGNRLVHLAVTVDDSVQTSTLMNNNPVIQTSSVTTQAVVSENGSLLLAGAFRHEQGLAENRAPIIGSIPLLGLPFKQKTVSNLRTQRYFLISPRIVKMSSNPNPNISPVWGGNPDMNAAAILLASGERPDPSEEVKDAAAMRRIAKEGPYPNLVSGSSMIVDGAPQITPGSPLPQPAEPTQQFDKSRLPKKPGFFSRLFHPSHHTDAPPPAKSP